MKHHERHIFKNKYRTVIWKEIQSGSPLLHKQMRDRLFSAPGDMRHSGDIIVI